MSINSPVDSSDLLSSLINYIIEDQAGVTRCDYNAWHLDKAASPRLRRLPRHLLTSIATTGCVNQDCGVRRAGTETQLEGAQVWNSTL